LSQSLDGHPIESSRDRLGSLKAPSLHYYFIARVVLPFQNAQRHNIPNRLGRTSVDGMFIIQSAFHLIPGILKLG
jgi:hypothetical protein